MPLRRSNIALSGLVIRNELVAKLVKRAFVDLVPRLPHQIEIEMQIVQCDQTQSENFLGLNQVADVTATEFAAAGAIAIVFDRSFVSGVFGILQIERAAGSKRGPIARQSRG